MANWLGRKNSSSDSFLKIGILGIILGTILKPLISQFIPSSLTNAIISFAVFILLIVACFHLPKGQRPVESTIKKVCCFLAIAYLCTAQLYCVKLLTGFPSRGYDGVTDLIGTLFYVAAWWTANEKDEYSRSSERLTMLIATAIAFVFAMLKIYSDMQLGNTTQNDLQASRLILNLSNGVIFLSLYWQLRRLYQSPDPVTHVILVLFGCSQVAAHGGDPLYTNPTGISIEIVAAHLVAWTMLLGKPAFAIYLLFLCAVNRQSCEESSNTVGTENK